jgi:hypothetical protein
MGTFEVIPSNEMSTREWFAYHLSEFEYSIIQSGSAFPDYTLRNANGDILRTEIEFDSYNFIQHGHKPSGCDLVMCWVHTFPLPLPVFELQSKRLYEAGKCDVVRKEAPPEYVAKARKLAKKQREKKQAILKLVQPVYEEFMLKLGADVLEYNRQMKEFQPTRLALLDVNDRLTKALNDNGYNLTKLHPYDLAHELAGLVEA